MNLYEKLNRLDDSLVESKRFVKKKKLTESVEDDKKKHFDAAASVKCKLDDDTIEYAMYDVDDFIENELTFVGNMLLEEHPEMLFWKYGDDSDNNFGGYFEVYESDDEYPDAYYQIVHDRLYDITDEVNGDYDYDDDIDEMLTENRWNPYFTPYGYRDAAKVLNGKAPEYYYHLKEIEMDRGDGVKLARYAMRKGLPVMVDKNSDPDYLEFAIKGEYHWNDYFYPYPTAHEEDLVAWDGKMFVENQLIEAELTPWEKIVKTFPDDFGHRSTPSANKTPVHHKTMNDYARDPNTPTYDKQEVTTKPEMTARDKLRKTFPDLDI